jgi:hypothetical protein
MLKLLKITENLFLNRLILIVAPSLIPIIEKGFFWKLSVVAELQPAPRQKK